MCGDTSSVKQQIVRKVIQSEVAFVEVGPICLDPNVEYDVLMIYRGVQPPNSDKIYTETSGINVVIESVRTHINFYFRFLFPLDFCYFDCLLSY